MTREAECNHPAHHVRLITDLSHLLGLLLGSACQCLTPEEADLGVGEAQAAESGSFLLCVCRDPGLGGGQCQLTASRAQAGGKRAFGVSSAPWCAGKGRGVRSPHHRPHPVGDSGPQQDVQL